MNLRQNFQDKFFAKTKICAQPGDQTQVIPGLQMKCSIDCAKLTCREKKKVKLD